jgi:hypothetical protein
MFTTNDVHTLYDQESSLIIYTISGPDDQKGRHEDGRRKQLHQQIFLQSLRSREGVSHNFHI